jgi:hypothetical protein
VSAPVPSGVEDQDGASDPVPSDVEDQDGVSTPVPSDVEDQDGASAPTHHPHSPRPYRSIDVSIFSLPCRTLKMTKPAQDDTAGKSIRLSLPDELMEQYVGVNVVMLYGFLTPRYRLQLAAMYVTSQRGRRYRGVRIFRRLFCGRVCLLQCW